MKEYICPHSCNWPCRNMVFSTSLILCHRKGIPDRIKLVKKRHPLEVAIIKEIARLRKYKHPTRRILWRVLKEGRKNETK